MTEPTGWEKALRAAGVIWQHDGHSGRPYALLTSGKISDTFFDLSYALAFPRITAQMVSSLAEILRREYNDRELSNLIICGQMQGSAGIAQMLAAKIGSGYMFTDKLQKEVGGKKRMVLAPRFEGIHDTGKPVILVEDVVSTASTSLLSRVGLNEAGFTKVTDLLLTAVNRVPSGIANGFLVQGCYKPDFKIEAWDRGKNPYTSDGQEIIEPMRPKTAEARLAMRRQYI